MFIQTEETPNPLTLKFLPGQPVLQVGTADFASETAAQNSPLAHRIFQVNNVKGVFFGIDFITVTKNDSAEWDNMKPDILGSIMDHYQSGDPVMANQSGTINHADDEGPNKELVNKIKELLDTRVRPAVAQDGGDITFRSFEDGIVYLHMQGACSGCPSSTMTLKMGIENLLRHYIPEVMEVRPVAA